MEAINHLQSLRSIRSTCQQIFALAEKNNLKHFLYHEAKFPEVVAYVDAEIKANYPKGNIPLHSRFRHINHEGKDRIKILQNAMQKNEDQLLALLEFVVLSVLLDAGAGPKWQYKPKGEEVAYQRSEGLALASFDMFESGFFAANPKQNPRIVNCGKLAQISEKNLEQAFQVGPQNPLVGLEGRAALLRRLGAVLPEDKRLGELFSPLLGEKRIDLTQLFALLLDKLGPIWPHGYMHQNLNLGDIGKHSAVTSNIAGCKGLVPFHKLTQWLTYSLLEPLELYGYKTENIDQLTALPEYRNGGLLLDLGVLSLQNPERAKEEHDPHSEFVTEWRALTIMLLDQIFATLKKKPQSNIQNLSQVLQGGTWSAGRKIAKTKRPDGSPPLKISSDGTVF